MNTAANHNSQVLWVKRLQLERYVREALWSQGFLEARTPLLVKSPGLEPHIKPFEVKTEAGTPSVFLPTSPEFQLKKLLATGVPKLFELSHSFRNEPQSPDHHPEFTMLEIYETNVSLSDFQKRIESVLVSLAQSIHPSLIFPFRDHLINFAPPWPRFTVHELFLKHAGIDLRTSPLAHITDDYFKIWLNEVEPKLPRDRPVFVSNYLLSQSSLCNPILDETGFAWANRFEIYVGQLELGNAFDELRDPDLQRKNFIHDQEIRRKIYGATWPESPIDDEMLQAISKMPPTSGIALGFDRIAMLLLNAKHLSEVIPLPSHWPDSGQPAR